MSKRIMKYNPAFLTDEELLRSFAVRQTDFDTIIRIIRENTTNVNQHVLVIGPRGIGKTTLLLRIGLETRTAEDLKGKWYPLVFAEESYSICSVGEFWLEALFHVAQQTGDKKWNQIIEELNDEKDDKRLVDRALAKLLDFADSQGKRLLLIIENFNMLFDGQIADQDAWTLRHTLINEPRIMLLASATSRMEQVDNSGSAMYELFKQHDLKPLVKDECIAVWEAIIGQHLKDDRIRPIQILTGGNPRLLSIISSFGSKLSFQDLMGDLLNLVDDNTEYFKSHLDNLPPIERKAYLALAELWDPAPAKDIARLARLDVNKTSSLMARLVSRGAVKVSEQSKRTKLYQTTERMYNIYYLMRKRGAPSERVKAVVNFMVSFYGHDELMKVTRSIAEEACGLALEDCRDHILAFETILNKLPQPLRSKIITSTPEKFLNIRKEIWPINIGSKGELENLTYNFDLSDKIDRAKAIRICSDALESNPDDYKALGCLGMILHAENRHDEAQKVFRRLFSINKQFALNYIVLTFYVNRTTSEVSNQYVKIIFDDLTDADVSMFKMIEFFVVEMNLYDVGVAIANSFLDKEALSVDNLNNIAWIFYKNWQLEYLLKSKEWIEMAIAIAPDNSHCQHTYACILSALENGSAAFDPAQKYLDDEDIAGNQIDDTIELFAGLTAAGCGLQALDMLTKSTIAEKMEPLIVGIRLYLGEEVQVATEILEVAKDVRQRIQKMRDRIEELNTEQKASKRSKRAQKVETNALLLKVEIHDERDK